MSRPPDKSMGAMFFDGAPTRKLNRLIARRPRGGIFWCGCCDRNMVRAGEKCEECGVRASPQQTRKRNETA